MSVEATGAAVNEHADAAQLDELYQSTEVKLVEALGERGVHIARRTVTKYRKALGIESSSRRKQF